MEELHTFYKHLMELNLMEFFGTFNGSFIFINIFTTLFN